MGDRLRSATGGGRFPGRDGLPDLDDFFDGDDFFPDADDFFAPDAALDLTAFPDRPFVGAKGKASTHGTRRPGESRLSYEPKAERARRRH
jgi:hypothetical protein